MSRAAFKVCTKKDMQSMSLGKLRAHVAELELRAELFSAPGSRNRAAAALKLLDQRDATSSGTVTERNGYEQN
jgi:hypothetical protein